MCDPAYISSISCLFCKSTLGTSPNGKVTLFWGQNIPLLTKVLIVVTLNRPYMHPLKWVLMPITYLRCCYFCVYKQLKASYPGRVKYNRSFQGQLNVICNEKLNRDSISYYPVNEEFQV